MPHKGGRMEAIMRVLILPENYKAKLTLRETQRAIKIIRHLTTTIIQTIILRVNTILAIGVQKNRLIAKKKDPQKNPQGPDVTVSFFAKPKQKMPDTDENGDPIPSPSQAEAKYIAQTIYDLIKNAKRLNGEKIKPSDIAVIYKAHSAASAITDALSEYGIQTSRGLCDLL